MDVTSLTLAQASRGIHHGSLRPTELVESLLARIHETEPSIKAYITLCEQTSLRMARAAESQLDSGYDLGPLHGIPISVKDLIETRGVLTTAGSKLFASYIPNDDATVVKKLKGAGALILGKTNTHEFALGGVTPPTKNPWDLRCIPGGSSGGSAAAIATSSALAALGSDTGGSIRIPSSMCGVVGLKPTYGRVSKAGVFPESWSLDHVGPITKTVEDCAMLMNVFSGFDRRDATSSRRPVPDYTRAIAAAEGLRGIRVGVPENYFFDWLQPDVRKCTNAALKSLEKLGAELLSFSFPMVEEIMGAYAAIDSAECSAYHDRYYRERARDYQPDVRTYLELGFFMTAVQYVNAQRTRGKAMSRILPLFDRFDVMVVPTLPMVATMPDQARVELVNVATSAGGHGPGSGGRRRTEDVGIAMVVFDAPFNLTGLPALTVPCGFARAPRTSSSSSSTPSESLSSRSLTSSDAHSASSTHRPTPSGKELPVGLQIVGRPYDEFSVLRVGSAYERATDWHNRRPPLS